MTKVLLFLANGFEEVEVAAFTDVLGWTRSVDGVKFVEVVVAGLHEEVKAAHSLIIKPQYLLEELNLNESLH